MPTPHDTGRPAAGPSGSPPAGLEHPHLLVRREQFEELRARRARSPWREFAATALADAEVLTDDLTDTFRHRAENLARALSVNALAHVLEPADGETTRRRIVGLIGAFDPDDPSSITTAMRENPDKSLWNYGVPTGNAFVQAVLALDVIHDDLDEDTLHRLEGLLRDGPAEYFRTTPLAWHQGTWASAAIWALYEGRAEEYQPVVERWLRDVLDSISADGVFTGGTGYAGARWTGQDREHKGSFGELLALLGVLPDWYEQPQLAPFQEWLTGYTHTPAGEAWTFGDSAPMRFDPTHQTGLERAGRYSALAGGYAAALLRGGGSPGLLSNYVLTASPLPAPVAAPSRVFPDGGAWLKEESLDPDGIAGVLWNLRAVDDAHAHKETNAVSLAAFGVTLLTNGGYGGWRTSEGRFSWAYLHDRALAASTALIDAEVPGGPDEEGEPSPVNDHVSPGGGGITSSLLTGRVDFASGDSGGALANGRHQRGFLLVHPTDGADGYVVCLDRVRPSEDGATVQLVWHGSSAEHTADEDGGVHRWSFARGSRSDVELVVHLATPPTRTTHHRGITAAWTPASEHAYLVAHYRDRADPARAIVTVLHPRDTARPAVPCSRFAAGGASGAVLQHGGVTDLVYACDPATDTRPDDAVDLSVRARAGHHRRDADGGLVHLWLEGATAASTGGWGIRTDHPVVLYRDDRRLRLGVDRETVVELSTSGPAGHPSTSTRLVLDAGEHEVDPAGP